MPQGAVSEVTIKQNFWPIFAVLVIGLIVAASVSWILDHPFGISWDEAQYFNRVQEDVRIFDVGGFRALAKSFLLEDRVRPPAYRVLMFPFSYLLGFSPAKARFVSLSFFVISLLFVYLATRRIAGRAAGAFAVIFLCLCPEIIFPTIVFGTEYALYLSIAAMLYFLYAQCEGQEESPQNWIGLGLAFALGTLAKASFWMIGGPILLLSFIIGRKIGVGPGSRFFFKSIVLGAIFALPWWILNARDAFWLASYARNYIRHSLGPPSFETWLRLLSSVAQSVIGVPLVILAILIIVSSTLGHFKSVDKRKNNIQKMALWVSFLSGVPLLFAILTGTNHNLRYITPALIPFAIGLGLLFDRTQKIHARFSVVISGMLFFIQLVMIMVPAVHPVVFPLHAKASIERPPWLVMARLEQWDWNQLREAARGYGLEEPSVSFLGNGRAFNLAQIMYPWYVHMERVPKVKWLWRYEDGPINLDKIMDSINDSDIVLTAPHYVGEEADKQDLDNQYNDEFARRLGTDSEFEGPIRIRMGRFEPIDIAVFVNKHSLHADLKG